MARNTAGGRHARGGARRGSSSKGKAKKKTVKKVQAGAAIVGGTKGPDPSVIKT